MACVDPPPPPNWPVIVHTGRISRGYNTSRGKLGRSTCPRPGPTPIRATVGKRPRIEGSPLLSSLRWTLPPYRSATSATFYRPPVRRRRPGWHTALKWKTRYGEVPNTLMENQQPEGCSASLNQQHGVILDQGRRDPSTSKPLAFWWVSLGRVLST